MDIRVHSEGAETTLQSLIAGQELSDWSCHQRLLSWLQEVAHLCQPEDIYLCTGSETEYTRLCQQLVNKQLFVPLDAAKRPRSYWCHSDPQDVARVESATFICSRRQEDAGPSNNWMDPDKMKDILREKFSGSMRGRTMYVVPFCMGPLDAPISLIGVEVTDSPYVVCSMHLMTRMGNKVLQKLQQEQTFVPCLHSVGQPLLAGAADVPWPCHPTEKYIVHFPEEKSVWSFGSGYGGNALLGKKSIALRIASVIARENGWLAEHMLIIGITNPQGKKKYMAAAFPSQCGKTNLALLSSLLPGWKVECIGDDIAWIRIGKGGQLYAVNPEAGFFGVAPGTSYKINANAMKTIASDTLFTNVALTADQDVWWEGMSDTAPERLIDWKGEPYDKGSGHPAAHPNARFTVRNIRCPILDPLWDSPEGVPLSAILFGGRRSSTVPLVYQSLSWNHGVFIGASISSETTAAATGEVGTLRHDPFAMLPFCGYHMGDYFAHWVSMGQKAMHPPAIFAVNWFQKNDQGRFIWPGFAENMRVLQWIFERCEEKSNYQETPIGYVPAMGTLPLQGLNVDETALIRVTQKEWEKEIVELEEYFAQFLPKFPPALHQELDEFKKRLSLNGKTTPKF